MFCCSHRKRTKKMSYWPEIQLVRKTGLPWLVGINHDLLSHLPYRYQECASLERQSCIGKADYKIEVPSGENMGQRDIKVNQHLQQVFETKILSCSNFLLSSIWQHLIWSLDLMREFPIPLVTTNSVHAKSYRVPLLNPKFFSWLNIPFCQAQFQDYNSSYLGGSGSSTVSSRPGSPI